MTQTYMSPVVALRDGYQPYDYNPGPYIDGAAAFLAGFGAMTRAIDDFDRAVAKKVLAGLSGLGLDETDVYPFGVVWALRCTGAVEGNPQLDAALTDWRTWEETDHVCEPLTFLPPLPGTGDTPAEGYPAHVLVAGGPDHYAAAQAQGLAYSITMADWDEVRHIAADPYTASEDVALAKRALADAGQPDGS